ncbi:hypothetical protein AcW1_003033 [Taiwanofungus camphoratus]|nr:hypothetical protein AcW1_003033 [Antrodia cinnamomea]
MALTSRSGSGFPARRKVKVNPTYHILYWRYMLSAFPRLVNRCTQRQQHGHFPNTKNLETCITNND